MQGENIKSAPSSSSARSSESINCIAGMKITLDLVASARRHLSFLRLCSSDGVVDGGSSEDLVRRSIRRYEELWMPLISEFRADEMLLLPPLDVYWIWHCHSLNHSHYRNYCNSRFNKLINRPAIFDEENEEYATDRCREIWESKYPSEPFDLEYSYSTNSDNSINCSDLFEMVEKCGSLGGYFMDAFMSETVYLVAAKRRYLNFVNLLKEVGEKDFSGRLVPTSDIYFMWLTHQSFPASYARDTSEIGDVSHKIAGFLNPPATTEEIEETKRLWEEEHDEPYERAGMAIDLIGAMAREIFNWEVGKRGEDVNRVYKGLQPRFLMEVRNDL